MTVKKTNIIWRMSLTQNIYSAMSYSEGEDEADGVSVNDEEEWLIYYKHYFGPYCGGRIKA
jgi:hypothetical protein